jgi:hypothetical protein
MFRWEILLVSIICNVRYSITNELKW